MEGIGKDQCNWDVTNTPPDAYNLSAHPANYCVGIAGAGVAVFEWTYNDPDCDPVLQFELQIDNDNNFDSPEVTRTIVATYNTVFSSDKINQLVMVKIPTALPGADYINYGTGYYWRVRVTDEIGIRSEWTYYNNGVGTKDISQALMYEFDYAHPSPNPRFTYNGPVLTKKPKPGESVYFNDELSQCYQVDQENPTSPVMVSCRGLEECVGGYCYTWNFGDTSPTDHTQGPVSHIYDTAKNYQASLTICDEIGCCVAASNVPVGIGDNGNVPEWKEITPF